MQIALIALLLFGGDLPDSAEQNNEYETDRAAIVEYIEAWQAGQDVEPFEVIIDPTWYDPALGGMNCNGDCEHIGPSHLGLLVKDWYDRGIACPPEIPRYSVLVFQPRYYRQLIARTCVDGGSAIEMRDDGVIRIDMLTQEPVWRDDYQATLYLPGMEVPGFVTTSPYAKLPNQPDFTCPLANCDRNIVLIQDVILGEHWGVDLWTGAGGIVTSPAAGFVTFADDDNGCGGSVQVDFGYGWTMRVCHLEKIYVNAGNDVQSGQALGAVGDSGLTLDGGHAHLELYFHDRPLNVLDFVEPVGFEFDESA